MFYVGLQPLKINNWSTDINSPEGQRPDIHLHQAAEILWLILISIVADLTILMTCYSVRPIVQCRHDGHKQLESGLKEHCERSFHRDGMESHRGLNLPFAECFDSSFRGKIGVCAGVAVPGRAGKAKGRPDRRGFPRHHAASKSCSGHCCTGQKSCCPCTIALSLQAHATLLKIHCFCSLIL